MKINKEVGSFTFRIIVLSFALLFGYFFLRETELQAWLPKRGYLLVPFFAVLNIGVHMIMVAASRKSGRGFGNYFLLASTIKLLVYLAALSIIFFTIGLSVRFAVVFFVFYLLYTAFEIFSLLPFLRRTDKSEPQ